MGFRDFSVRTVEELQQELRAKGLPVSGKKAELVARLEVAHGFPTAVDATVKEDDQAEGLSERRPPPAAAVEDDFIRPGDTVFLKAHTGNHLDVQDSRVKARWDDHGDWQRLVIEKSPLVIEKSNSTVFTSGDLAFFRTCIGTHIEVEGENVGARWNDHGTYQGLVLVKQGGGQICDGDALYLQAHTGNYVDVSGERVAARWADEGEWQRMVIERRQRSD